MGIPAPGTTFLGAAVNGTSDLGTRETQLGSHLSLHRTYFQANNIAGAVKQANADHAAGRLPWISFKEPLSWADMAAGKGNTWATQVADGLATVDGPIWLAVHHEPENDGDMALWTQMQAQIAPDHPRPHRQRRLQRHLQRLEHLRRRQQHRRHQVARRRQHRHPRHRRLQRLRHRPRRRRRPQQEDPRPVHLLRQDEGLVRRPRHRLGHRRDRTDPPRRHRRPHLDPTQLPADDRCRRRRILLLRLLRQLRRATGPSTTPPSAAPSRARCPSHPASAPNTNRTTPMPRRPPPTGHRHVPTGESRPDRLGQDSPRGLDRSRTPCRTRARPLRVNVR